MRHCNPAPGFAVNQHKNKTVERSEIRTARDRASFWWNPEQIALACKMLGHPTKVLENDFKIVLRRTKAKSSAVWKTLAPRLHCSKNTIEKWLFCSARSRTLKCTLSTSTNNFLLPGSTIHTAPRPAFFSLNGANSMDNSVDQRINKARQELDEILKPQETL